MQKEDVRFQNSTIFEGMTSIRALIDAYGTDFNDRKIEKILYDGERIKKIGKDVGYLNRMGEKLGFAVEESDAEKIASLSVGSSHGGIIAQTTDRTIPLLTEDVKLPEKGFFAMIDGIEDPYNFGYALRSLYACGCTGILLPDRNWFTASGVVARSSAGASERFPAFRTTDPLSLIDLFHKASYKVVCAEEKTDLTLGKCNLPLPLLLIVGGEKRGVPTDVKSRADLLVKIPYARPFSASLSAASAATIFAYEVARQNFN